MTGCCEKSNKKCVWSSEKNPGEDLMLTLS